MRQKENRLPLAVLDTNILISYILGSETIAKVMALFRQGQCEPVVCSWIEHEFLDTSRRPRIAKRVSSEFTEDFIKQWHSYARFVEPRGRVTVCRDPTDNAILECGIEAKADYIVTGDDDLLSMGSYEWIKIVTPMEFLHTIQSQYES